MAIPTDLDLIEGKISKASVFTSVTRNGAMLDLVLNNTEDMIEGMCCRQA